MSETFADLLIVFETFETFSQVNSTSEMSGSPEVHIGNFDVQGPRSTNLAHQDSLKWQFFEINYFKVIVDVISFN